MVWGRPVTPAVVGRVAEGSAGGAGGTQAGRQDRRRGRPPVQYWDEVQAVVQESRGRKLALAVQRRGRRAHDRGHAPAGDGPRHLRRRAGLLGSRRAAGGVRSAKIGEVVPGRTGGEGRHQAWGHRRVRVRANRRVVGRPCRCHQQAAGTADRTRNQTAASTTLTMTVTPAATGPEGNGRIGISHSVAPGPGSVFVRSNPVVGREGRRAEDLGVDVPDGQGHVQARDRCSSRRPTSADPSRSPWPRASRRARASRISRCLHRADQRQPRRAEPPARAHARRRATCSSSCCEAVLGRPISLRKREIAQQVGFVLLMMLMVYAVYNDCHALDVFHRFFR